MMEIVPAVAEELRHHWEWLLSASLKVTAWLLLAGLVLRLLRRSSASIRQAVSVAAAVGVAVIFVLNLSPIPNQFGWRPFAELFAAPSAAVADIVEAEVMVSADRGGSEMAQDSVLPTSIEPAVNPSRLAGWFALDALGALVALWWLGVVIVGWRVLRRVCLSHRGLGAVKGSTVAPERLLALARREALRLKLKPDRLPHLCVADKAMPMIFGLRRAVIVLPAEAIEWPQSKVVSVLRHELLHLRRGDLWWTLLVELALLPAWWHPLARALKRQVAELTEQACDDAVIASGSAPVAYVRDLLSLSRKFRAPRPAALAIPARSGSESAQLARFRRVLDETASRRSLSTIRLSVIAAVALGCILPGTLLVSCSTTDAAADAHHDHTAGAEAAQDPSSLRHPPIEGVPANAEKLVFKVKFFEIDVTQDARFAEPGVAEWVEGKRELLSPDEGFRLFHPQRIGVDILTTPAVVTRPGEEATIEIGQRVPYVVAASAGEASPAGTLVGAFDAAAAEEPLPPEVDFIPVGVLMKLKAVPSEDPEVLTALLIPSVSEQVGTTVDELGNATPEISTQRQVFDGSFSNGSYLCLGVKVDIQSVKDKVPLLGDIPLLGRLFRSEQTVEVRRLIAVQVVVEEWEG